MAKQVLEWFNLEADIEFEIDRSSATLNSLNAQILGKVGIHLAENKPDLVVVQGDTASAYAGSIAAFNEQIPVAHLEAGLRTHNIYSPYPEEAYRQMISRVAELHMCPTAENKQNLLDEGIHSKGIMVTGNTVVDAFEVVSSMLKSSNFEESRINNLASGEIVLVTAHRRENLGEGMSAIAEAIREVALTSPSLNFVVPMHPNPSVRTRITPVLSDLPNVHLLEPLEYPEFISILSRSKLVLTDSGGVQEEAPILGIPAIVMRENTERPEGVNAGGVVLVGANKEKIVLTLNRLLTDSSALRSMAQARNPYGDGRASLRCISLLDEYFGIGKRRSEFKSDN
jgi:UDP-N-acetylglucosamine 2-epimerase (non-hydrolysing)